MSLGAPQTPKPQKKLSNISGADTSSNQQAVLGTYFAGVAKIALTWISPPYNLTTENVKSSDGGKASSKGGGSAPTQKNYRCDLAGFACVCPDDAPVDATLFVLVNDEIAFTGPLSRAAGTHYASLTLEQYCQEARVYWGTKDQPIDSLILTPRGPLPTDPVFSPRDKGTWKKSWELEGEPGETPGDPDPVSGHYDFHPAYRNQCYFVFKQFFLGASQNMPNVVVILARGARKITGGGTWAASEQGVPPISPIYEILTDDMFGAGKSDADLDLTSFTDTQTANFNNRLAPVIRQGGSFRSFLADYVQYYDGWFRRSGRKIEAGYFPQGYINPTTLPQIASDDLTEEPKVKPLTDRKTKNDFRIVYTNREAWYNDDGTLRYINSASITRIGRRRKEVVQRGFIIDAALAQQYIVKWGSVMSELGSNGSFPVKRERAKAAGYRQGDLVNLESAADALAFVVRIKQMDRGDDRDGTLNVTFENHRANWPILYVQPPDPKDPDFEVYSSEITQVLIKELPAGELKDSRAIEVGVLARRPSNAIIGYHLYFSIANVTYDRILNVGHFAVYGKVAVLYPDTTATVDGSVGLQVDLYGTDLGSIISQTSAQRDDNNLLLFSETEIMSVWTKTSLGNGRFRFYLKRALYGTVKSNHEVGMDCWFIYRSQLIPVANKNFVAGATRYFKLQGYTNGPAFPLVDCAPVSHLFGGGAVSPITNLVPTTSYATTSEGKIDARILATWDYALDQDIATFVFSIKRTADSNWESKNVGGDPAAKWIGLEPKVSYQVRVMALSASGDPSAWSAIATIITAGPAVPAAPTGLTTIPGLKAVGLTWNALADDAGISKTEIGATLIPSFEPGVIARLNGAPDSHVVSRDDVDLGYFYAVRRVNSVGERGPWNATIQQGVPLSAIGQQCLAPFFAFYNTGAGVFLGEADYRFKITDKQPGGSTIYAAFNGGAWFVYSKTGNYQSPSAGSVLPTGNVGAVSMAKSDWFFAYSVKAGFLQSKTVELYNNGSNTPDSGGGGGTVGGGGGVDAGTKYPN